MRIVLHIHVSMWNGGGVSSCDVAGFCDVPRQTIVLYSRALRSSLQ